MKNKLFYVGFSVGCQNLSYRGLVYDCRLYTRDNVEKGTSR